MATWWEIGDKALCTWKSPGSPKLVVGDIYTVTNVVPPDCFGIYDPGVVGLELGELAGRGVCIGCGEVHPILWRSDRFRKIKPDKKEAGEECKQLLKLFDRKPEYA
jgi:hypothetical protein